ncbi:unnamed protein product [Didymodactylos carnosus]|uniref:N-acetyltransferase domain-containing protein n=1 Tax=Didymodactylos carnosus TaxID=1234261 RepID=A0A815PFE1_9BILA|nr:unnamed protein product [Didymodactylos carnosus]CAF4322374.1 unnamed protein product [Didymodactylos carnosus]
MKIIKYLKLIVGIVMFLNTVKLMQANEMISRKQDIDYQSFYTGTETLETKRLILRQITLDDAEDMFKFTSDPQVETWDPIDETVADTRMFIEFLQKKYAEKEPALWGIADKNTNKIIGYCGFNHSQPEHSIVELEYALDKAYWNQGLMSEALEAIFAFTFNILKINRVIAFIVIDNIRSERVALKLGMQLEGVHREAGYTRGAFWDMKSYVMLRNDYRACSKSYH